MKEELTPVDITHEEPKSYFELSTPNHEENAKKEIDAAMKDAAIEDSETVNNDLNAEKQLDEEVEEPQHHKKNIWKLRRALYNAESEREALKQQNLEIQKMLQHSLENGAYHYSKSVYADHQRALEAKKTAIETGDIEALVKADQELMRNAVAINELEKLEYQKQPTPESTAPNNLNTQTQEKLAEHQYNMARVWLNANPELDSNSNEYDTQLANTVHSFVNELDATLYENGQEALICSPDYFKVLDEQIRKIKPKKKSYDGRYIGSVRSKGSSMGSVGNQEENQPLTSEQKELAALFNLSEDEYRKRYNKAKAEATQYGR